MMFFFIPALVPIGVISADYQAQDFDTYSYDEVSHHICEQFRQDLAAYNKEHEVDSYNAFAQDSNIVILWRNVPDAAKGKVDFSRTLDLICSNQCERGNVLYIHSIADLVDTYGFRDAIHYLYLLNSTGKKVFFLDNEYFSDGSSDKEIKEITDSIESSDKIDSAIKGAMIDVVEHRTLSLVLEHLDAIIPPVEQTQMDNFVSFYWDWQRAKKSIEECMDTLGVYHRTFYKYSQIYEESPYYCEHLKLYPSTNSIAKRGALPDKEAFMLDKEKLTSNEMTVKEFCKKYSIMTEADIPRIELALTQRRRKAK